MTISLHSIVEHKKTKPMENTTQPTETKIKWYHYLAALFAGFFLVNVVPHFIHGVSGDPFPTPFSDPPGKGLSSPTVNVIWALGNLVVGYLLYRGGKISGKNIPALIIFFIGMAAISIML